MARAIGSTNLSLLVEAAGKLPSLAVSGKIDSSNIAHVVSVLRRMLHEHESCIALNLDGVEHVDPGALSGLAESATILRDRSRRLCLDISNDVVRGQLDRHFISDLFCQRRGEHCNPESCTGACEGWQTAVFTLPSHLENCREVRERIGRVASRLGFSKDSLDDVMLAVGEAVSNAIRHGHSGAEDSAFTVSCIGNSEKLCISISDNGTGFRMKDLPTFEEALFMERGRGVYCMRAVMDEVSYHFDHGTTVKMIKYRK